MNLHAIGFPPSDGRHRLNDKSLSRMLQTLIAFMLGLAVGYGIREQMCRRRHRRHQFIVAILLAAALPAFAQTQNPSAAKITKADVQKVFKIISGNKTKSQTYCNIVKLVSQITEGSEQNTDELYQKIEELVPKLGREYVALMDALQDVEPESQVGQEIESVLAGLNRLCTR